MLTVTNGKKDGFVGSDIIYIGRRNARYNLEASALANPYVVGRDGDRDNVIAMYRRYLWQYIKKGLQGEASQVWNVLQEIKNSQKDKNIKLACYCKPKGCHGDIIVRAINYMIEQENK